MGTINKWAYDHRGYIALGLILSIPLVYSIANYKSASTSPKPLYGDHEMKNYLSSVDSVCNMYQNQINDIQRSHIFNDNKSSLLVSVKEVRGAIKSINTDHGGSKVSVNIRIMGRSNTYGDYLSPGTDFDDLYIDQSSSVYAAVSYMKDGECVIFSANDLREHSNSEMGQICDPDYYMHLTEIKKCQ